MDETISSNDNNNIQESNIKNEKDCLIDDDKVTDLWLKSKFKIYKNLLVIGLAWIFQFTAYQSMAILQSSLNQAKGLGTASLSTIYVALVISSLLLPPILIRHVGLKWTIVFSQATYTLFIASNIYPRFYTSIPTAVILGLGAAPLWTAKCTYLTEIAGYYARLSKETTETVVNRFFGIFFAMFQTSQIFGNVISSTILKQGLDNSSNNTINITFCGAKDCPGGEGSKIKKPEETTLYLLCGIYVASAIFAMILIMIFLSTYKRKEIDRKETSYFETLISTFKHMGNKYQILILPMTLWLGFQQAFLGADYTKSYVSCVKGVDYVGLTMISYGVVDALCSYGFGQLMKYTGRISLIIFGAILHYGIIITLFIWEPKPDQIYVIYLMPILWGVCDAIWQTQINSFYGVIFNNCQEAAFSNFRLWESLGFAIAYAYSNYLCVSIKLYLLLGYLTLAILGYGTIEVLERLKQKK